MRSVQLIEDLGHTTSAAHGWAQALHAARVRKPDLVLLDVVMPTVDGFKLTRQLKAESEGFLPILLLSSLQGADAKWRAMGAGADDLLSKPVDPVELEIRMRSMLRIRKLAAQLCTANRKLEELALTDELTGLLNRRAADDGLRREFSRANRYQRDLSVLLLDVDHFKGVNDTYGHGVGDVCLQLVGGVLREQSRTSDIATRYGGEEFLVIAPDTDEDGALLLGERLRRCVQESSRSLAEGPAELTVSIGVSTLGHQDTTDALVQGADQALYTAKRDGRNRVQLHTSE